MQKCPSMLSSIPPLQDDEEDVSYPFKRQINKVAKHTQTIRGQFADELCVFGHFVGLALKGLR